MVTCHFLLYGVVAGPTVPFQNGQHLTMERMVKKRWNISMLQPFPHDNQEGYGCIGIPSKLEG